jgi:hypothetical protein
MRGAYRRELAADDHECEDEAPPGPDDEAALDAVDDWGHQEDWSDWVAWADCRDVTTLRERCAGSGPR